MDLTAAPMPTRRLGRTGWAAGRLVLGGVKWDSHCPESDAIRLIRRAYELGVNTFDTAHGYGNGQSETRLGKALADVRDRVFISTKTGERSYDTARRQIDESLRRLGTDRIDLLFLHAVDDEADLARILGPDSVLRAVEEYRAAGQVRFVGASSHHYRGSLLKLMAAYPLDAVLCPAGLFNLAYGYDYLEAVLPAAREHGMAVLGMKVLGAGRAKHAASIEPYLRYGLHSGVDAMVIGCDTVAQLEQMVAVIKRQPEPLSPDEARALHPECRRVTQSWDRGEYNWVAFYRTHRP